MSYYEILDGLIREKRFSNRYVANECTKLGAKTSDSYISKLRKGRSLPPSAEISECIGKICGIDERILVLEGYMETAPTEIKEALKKIYEAIVISAYEVNKEKIKTEEIERVRKELSITSYSKLIMELNNMETEEMIGEVGKQNNNVLEIMTIDNAMAPHIPKNSKFTIKFTSIYKDGEIYWIKIKETEEMIVRYYFEKEGRIILIPFNKEFESKTYNKDEIQIIGKVDKVIISL